MRHDCPVAFYLRAALARCPRLVAHAVELELAVWDYCIDEDIELRLGPTLQRVVHDVCGEHLGRELEEMGRVGA